jgi:DNA-binding MarR family transcriptional regulator
MTQSGPRRLREFAYVRFFVWRQRPGARRRFGGATPPRDKQERRFAGADMSNTSREEKARRAYRAYLDLLDAAEWMRRQLRGQFESFDLTPEGFRLLEALYREGPVSVAEAAKRRRYQRQNFDALIGRLVERGWVRRTVVSCEPAEIETSRLPKALRGRPRRGRRLSMAELTPSGKRFIGVVLPRHLKTVKAFMLALEAREQETLSRLCRKLREGDAEKFIDEMTL